eukprot:6192181-Pleurochrysis_carterae.AAC.2
MKAGPFRHVSSSLTSNIASRVHVLAVRVGRQKLREDVRHILARVGLADFDTAMRDVLSNLQVRADRRVSSVDRNACPLTAPRRPSCPRTSGSHALPRAPSPCAVRVGR